MPNALRRLSRAMIVDAPSTAAMPIGMACCAVTAMHGVASPWDKGFLDPYEGEPGFSRRTRGILLLTLPFASWGAVGAFGYGVYAACRAFAG